MTNPDLKKYVFRWEGMSFTHGLDVYDQNYQKLGIIKDESKIITKKLTFFDNENSRVVEVRQKKKGFSESMDILDFNEDLLGIAEDKELSAFIESSGEVMRLVDPQGNDLLTSSGVFLSPYETPKEIRTFFINTIKGKPVCKLICKIEENHLKKVKDWLKPVKYKNICTVEIFDANFNRKLLLGFLLAIMTLVYGKDKVSD